MFESPGHPPGALVHLGEVELDAGVVLGCQDPVGSGALPDIEKYLRIMKNILGYCNNN